MDDKNISLIALESAMMHLQTVNKRLAIITVIALIFMASMFGFFVYVLTNFEITTEDVVVDSDYGNANYIGNDGDIVNESGTSQEVNDKEKEQQ